ncbi:hypothetical protein RIF29_16762 [Crotalaria pallida]|uniref:Uncharacterized protein n=1 Tax=Crotalaria pallida TaxID=3830 RepID=A0AAN9FFW0_CROPI
MNFNLNLKEALVQLRKDLSKASITYVDVKYSLFQQPKKYGFKDPLVSCCGYRGKDESSIQMVFVGAKAFHNFL